MNWFVTQLIFRIKSGEGNHTAQFDEQLRLISANTEEEAYRKALQIGKAEEDSFINTYNEKVEWQFIGIAEMNKIQELSNGTELCSKIVEAENADHYAVLIEQKNSVIESRLLR